MDLILYNTLSRRKEKFQPLDSNNIRMYVCGPTVYDYAHIGNARPVVVFDVLFRLLRHLYGEKNVTYVRNITDIDDKINDRAFREGVPIQQLTEKTIDQYHEDVLALGTLSPTIEPRATDHVINMLEMIETLVESGKAYVAEGHVLFDVTSMPEYGDLSKRSLDEMIAGARVEVAPYKRDPMDFVLWKPSKPEEPSWKSKWGEGRPGWHIECSAMSSVHLGQEFDIHGGGIDLVFPHHENEIAQSRCAHGTNRMATIWMHNGFLRMEGEKMAKSVGNIISIHELLKNWPGEVIRLALLMKHYRLPIDFSKKGLNEAKSMLDGWYKAVEGIEPNAEVAESVVEPLANDLNTSNAIASLHQLKAVASNGDTGAAQSLKSSGNLLGLLQNTTDAWFAWRPSGYSFNNEEIERLIERRVEARRVKDYKTSDQIRDQLADMGIILSDTKNSQSGEIETSWHYK